MAKTNITEYSATPSSNTDINNINIDENCPASGLNNAIRELMAHLKNVDTGSQALTALSVTGALSCGALTSNGIDDNASSTAITLDSSGNLLVGKTSTASGAGAELRADGQIVAYRSNNRVAYLDRLGSDGDIVTFQKDGSEVGSIGAYAGRLNIGSGDTGIQFNPVVDSIFPYNVSTTANGPDNTVNLGTSGFRFKDLYLGGGLYVGGTGSANYLDDYEEGTFEVTATPAISGTATVNSSYNTLSYTKIGRLVTITGDIRISSFSSAVGHLLLYGLPFTVASLTDGAGRAFTATYFYQGSTAAVSAEILYVADGLTRLQIFKDTNTMTNNSEIGIAISYMSA